MIKVGAPSVASEFLRFPRFSLPSYIKYGAKCEPLDFRPRKVRCCSKIPSHPSPGKDKEVIICLVNLYIRAWLKINTLNCQ